MRSLVVDDVLVAREMLATLLEAHGEVERAADGASALELFSTAATSGSGFDLVCVDIGLPDMDGLDCVDRFRHLEEQLGMPRTATAARIIVVTASESGHNVLRAFRAQADAYLQKPYTKADLDAHLEKLGLLEPT